MVASEEELQEARHELLMAFPEGGRGGHWDTDEGRGLMMSSMPACAIQVPVKGQMMLASAVRGEVRESVREELEKKIQPREPY